MIVCFMDKSNHDLIINPTAAPTGATRELWHKVKKAALEEVRAVAKADWLVGKGAEKYGDVDHQIKKARVDGMHLQVTKNQIDAIVQQIRVMQGNSCRDTWEEGVQQYDCGIGIKNDWC